jgi:hypothetical protein
VENPNFETCSSFLAKIFPTGKPSHLPLISPHICLQISSALDFSAQLHQNIKFHWISGALDSSFQLNFTKISSSICSAAL